MNCWFLITRKIKLFFRGVGFIELLRSEFSMLSLEFGFVKVYIFNFMGLLKV